MKRGRMDSRYFVLTPSNLMYWSSQEEYEVSTEPRGFIWISDILDVRRVENAVVVAFSASGKNLSIGLFSQEEEVLDHWARRLDKCRTRAQEANVADEPLAINIRSSSNGRYLAKSLSVSPEASVGALAKRIGELLGRDASLQALKYNGAVLALDGTFASLGVPTNADIEAVIVEGALSNSAGEPLGRGRRTAKAHSLETLTESAQGEEEVDVYCQGPLCVIGKASGKMEFYFALTSDALAYWPAKDDMDAGVDPEGFVVTEHVVAFVATATGFSLHVRHKLRTRLLEFRIFDGGDVDPWVEAFRELLADRLDGRFRDFRAPDCEGGDYFENLELAPWDSAPASPASKFGEHTEATYVQVDKVVGLPRVTDGKGGADTYILRACWVGDEDDVQTEERLAYLAEAERGAEQCDVRQQLVLANAASSQLEVRLLRRRRPNAPLGADVEDVVLGSFRLDAREAVGRPPRMYELAGTAAAAGAAILVRMRLRGGRPSFNVAESPSAEALLRHSLTENVRECQVPAALPSDDPGLRFAATPGRIFVEEVAPSSWAEQQEVHQGDELLFVGTELACELSPTALSTALARRPVGLTFVRGAKPRVPEPSVAQPGEQEGAEVAEDAAGNMRCFVRISFEVENLGRAAAANAKSAVLDELRAAFAREVLVHAGPGVQQDDVAVRLEPAGEAGDGRVAEELRVQAIVVPSRSSSFSPAAAYAELRSCKAQLGKALIAAIRQVPDVGDLLSGPIKVRHLKCLLLAAPRRDPHTRLHMDFAEREQRHEQLRLAQLNDESRASSMVPRPKPADLSEVSERLYGEHAERMRRKLQRQQARLEELSRAAGAAPTSRGESAGTNPDEAGARLHALHANRIENRRQAKAAKDAEAMCNSDIVANRGRARGVRIGNHDALYEDAREKRVRQMLAEVERRRQVAAEEFAHVPAAPSRGLNMDHIKELHDDHANRRSRKVKRTVEQEVLKAKELEKSVADAKNFLVPEQLRDVAPKVDCWGWATPPRSATPPPPLRRGRSSVGGTPRSQLTPQSSVALTTTPPQSESDLTARKKPLGFGSRQKRLTAPAKIGDAEGTQRFLVDTVDHVIIAMNAAVSLRTGCEPVDAEKIALRALVEPVTLALDHFRLAAEESEQNEGGVAIKQRPSMRLYAEVLREEPAGRKGCQEPDPIRHISDSAETLHNTAQAAQLWLLRRMLPRAAVVESIATEWPARSCMQQLRVRQAAFAWNPGVKSKAAMRTKAFVRYGPSRKNERFLHVLDVARVSLVFECAATLLEGLDALLSDDELEVVAVRNHYQPSMQSLLGERFVEVLVVKGDTEVPEAHVCEIRLEERCFFQARQSAWPQVERICRTFREVYEQPHMHTGAIEYLAMWTLRRPKEQHTTTIFRRSIAKSFGSICVAYRRRLSGPGNLATFAAFRDVCHTLNCRRRAVELWQDLDATMCGSISVFELDPDAVVLLARFWASLVSAIAADRKMGRKEIAAWSAQDLVAWMLSKSQRLQQPRRDCLERPVLRHVVKLLGLPPTDADRIFAHLFFDSTRKETERKLSEALSLEDIDWVRKLLRHVDLDAVMLTEGQAVAGESAFVLRWPGRSMAARRESLTPGALRHLGAARGISPRRVGVGPRKARRSTLPAKPFLKPQARLPICLGCLELSAASVEIDVVPWDPDIVGAADYLGLGSPDGSVDGLVGLDLRRRAASEDGGKGDGRGSAPYPKAPGPLSLPGPSNLALPPPPPLRVHGSDAKGAGRGRSDICFPKAAGPPLPPGDPAQAASVAAIASAPAALPASGGSARSEDLRSRRSELDDMVQCSTLEVCIDDPEAFELELDPQLTLTY